MPCLMWLCGDGAVKGVHGSWRVEGGAPVAEARGTGRAVPVPREAAVRCCMVGGTADSPQESLG